MASDVIYTYDGGSLTATTGTPQHIAITGSRGNLTMVQTPVNNTVSEYQTFSYYDTGAVNQSTGISLSATTPGSATTYTYGTGSCGNSFVTSVSEPLGLSRAMTWSCPGGVVTQTQDENLQTVTTTYNDPNLAANETRRPAK